MVLRPHLNPQSETPLYRQLFDYVKDLIATGQLSQGDRLPPTRELAGLLGLNRTTVSAAYELLESEALIQGQVGRGSFVCAGSPAPHAGGLISFATSRPSEQLFPVEEFRATCGEVLQRPDLVNVLQLGSPAGYPPLRSYLLEEARRQGAAGPGDDILITSGCQQALDLIHRVMLNPGDTVVVEDPVYPGLKTIFSRGVNLIGVPVGAEGLDVDYLERVAAREKPRLLLLTPNFQNPTGATLPLAARAAVLRLARESGLMVIENDLYGQLRYEGEALPALKQLDESGSSVLLRSFSKVAFPGLRVGWVVGPAALIGKLAEAKQWCDLHTDQLSQAVLLRFAESGRLAAHLERMLAAGACRLRAAVEGCARSLPEGATFTRPSGGMNLWVRLPEPLDAAELLARAQAENVAYLPGKYFEVSRHEPGALRLSFGGPAPERIETGLRILGTVFSNELARLRTRQRWEPAPAMV